MPLADDVALQRSVIQGGIEIHHYQEGRGPALVFIHGGLGDWSSWAPQWDAFTPRYRCITYSRRYSSPNSNQLARRTHSVIIEAQDLAALLAEWNAEPAILVGTSYGAYTALQLALQHPEKVRAMALTEPPVLRLAERTADGRQALDVFRREVLVPSDRAFLEGRYDLAVRLLTQGINGTGPGEASTPGGLMRRLRNANAMRALAMSDDPYPALDEAALRDLTVPTLLLQGSRTQAVHRATFQALSRLLPRARVQVVEGAGHGIHRDAPDAFNRTVREFLSGLGL